MSNIFDLLAQSESYQFGQTMGRIFMLIVVIIIAVGVIKRRQGK